jgi:hypothetical protein
MVNNMCVLDLLPFQSEVREFRGVAPKSLLGLAGSPKSPDHGDHPPLTPPLRVVSPPPLINKKM